MNKIRIAGNVLSGLQAVFFCFITAPGILLLALVLSVPSPSAFFVSAARTFSETVPVTPAQPVSHDCAVVPLDDPWPRPCLQRVTPESDFILKGDRFLVKFYLLIALLNFPVWCLLNMPSSANRREGH
ncbi:hypothetical protein HF650_24755 (plasmid) [Kosakonia sp. SMBL-WEM22]|uniref:hypothetical protein n=1 Tax=Kosakonia sp. SMBL-WEM22 TaxID=2725560 RepID=UPI0016591610|nr:hypothetical protein [Kosakonia sp. SMBL-WEM22]QNQ22968.1 hypothetical protein HF650_24755 [Kosakonia sp. SMBL-WEM22]